MKIADVRQSFLRFFQDKGHEVVPSSSLVPGNDPTLLFTNAGMVQFKDVFLGSDKRPYQRAASSQRCVRAGGKHNDLENVGYTARHHTFFEMLGNFSFGDYFKRDAIGYAWEFLTQVLGLPEQKLWVTVHISDDEAADIWLKEVGVSAERFSRLDEDNFWQMGDTGPCGPCSEIFYDHGPNVAGGPPGSPNDDGDRYIEIWNLVFMQFERRADGELVPLPNPSIDTGMGLERIAAVMQGVHSNYEVDLFQNLIAAAAKVTGTTDLANQSLRVIADHIRSCAFLVLDGVLPSNEGRGYVLRRIIRRALRHGQKLGQAELFFSLLVDALVKEMGEAYPELKKQQSRVTKVLAAEEEQFARTLEKGLAVLEEAISQLQGQKLPGELVFKLYDTFGFPVDLTNDIARERNLSLDMAGYERSMSEQRERARAASQFGMGVAPKLKHTEATEFVGYDRLEDEGAVVEVLAKGESAQNLEEGQEGMIVLDRTVFYAESGGQIGDCGYLEAKGVRFEVVDCRKQGKVHLHIGKVLQGRIQVGDKLTSRIDADLRQAIVLNHSATHLLHAALRQILGEHVSQQGSLVDSEKTRFDFSHSEPVKREQILEIEELVNAQIRANTEAQIELMDIESARTKGAMMLFGEKYGDEVRVLTMGDGFSIELCGGTHVRRTGDIGLFKIVSESGIASGVRRIEAITGKHALAYLKDLEDKELALVRLLRTDRTEMAQRVEQLVKQNKELARELEQVKMELASSSGGDLTADARDINGARVLIKRVDGLEPKGLRELVDQLRQKLGSSVVLLASVKDDKIAVIAGVSQDMTNRYAANELVASLATQIGGKGGGRPDMAQGGGTDVGALDAALKALSDSLASS